MPISYSEQITVLIEKMNRLYRIITLYEKAVEDGIQISYPVTIAMLKSELELVRKQILKLKQKVN